MQGSSLSWKSRIFGWLSPAPRPPEGKGPARTEAEIEAACTGAAKAALDAFARQAEPWWEQKAAAWPAGRA